MGVTIRCFLPNESGACGPTTTQRGREGSNGDSALSSLKYIVFPAKRKLFGGQLTFFYGFFPPASPPVLGNLFVDQQNQTNELLTPAKN